jgi:hypothetical protein
VNNIPIYLYTGVNCNRCPFNIKLSYFRSLQPFRNNSISILSKLFPFQCRHRMTMTSICFCNLGFVSSQLTKSSANNRHSISGTSLLMNIPETHSSLSNVHQSLMNSDTHYQTAYVFLSLANITWT